MRDWNEKLLMNLLVPLSAVIISFALGGIFIAAIGKNPFWAYGRFFAECFGSGYGFGQVLQKTTQLIFCGLAVAIGFRAGLFNIGVEGQLYIAAFATAILGVSLAFLPGGILIPICILGALIVGGLWAAIPGLLKAVSGAHEVITTIMMNFISFALVNYFITLPGVAVENTVITHYISPGAQLPRLSVLFPAFQGSTANFSLFLGLFCIVATWYLLWWTPLGYELRAVGLNPRAARLGGINLKKTIILTMFISGALGGLVGIDFVLGYKYYFEEGFSGGIGFIGIAVALLGRNHPLGVLMAAFLFGILSYGKIALTGTVPKEIVEILQAIIILSVVCSNEAMRMLLRRWRKRRLLKEET